MSHEWKKGRIGYYHAMFGHGPVIEARVLRCHRDGTVTVQALWRLDADGNQTGLFVGYKYRLEARHLSTSQPRKPL
jgi:hypothetical protein